MFSSFEIAQAMRLIARNVKNQPREFVLRALDTLAWAEKHLTEYEKSQIIRLSHEVA